MPRQTRRTRPRRRTRRGGLLGFECKIPCWSIPALLFGLKAYQDPKNKPQITKIKNFVHTYGTKPVMEMLQDTPNKD